MSWQFCLPLCPIIMIVSFRQKRHTFWCTSGAEWSPLLRPSPRSCVRHRRPAPATPATAREATSTASTTARTRWTLIDERLLLLQHCVCELRRKPKVMADGICRFEEKPLPSLSLLGSTVSTLAAHLVGLSGGLSPICLLSSSVGRQGVIEWNSRGKLRCEIQFWLQTLLFSHCLGRELGFRNLQIPPRLPPPPPL